MSMYFFICLILLYKLPDCTCTEIEQPEKKSSEIKESYEKIDRFSTSFLHQNVGIC